MTNLTIVSGNIFNVKTTEKGTSGNLSFYNGKNQDGSTKYAAVRVFVPTAVLGERTLEEKCSVTVQGRLVPGSYTNQAGETVYSNTLYAEKVEKSAKGINLAVVEGSIFVKGETQGKEGKAASGYGNLSVVTGRGEDGKNKYSSINLSLSPYALTSIKNLKLENGNLCLIQGSLSSYKNKAGMYIELINVNSVMPVFINKKDTEAAPAATAPAAKKKAEPAPADVEVEDDFIPFDDDLEELPFD